MNWFFLLVAFASSGESTVIDRVFERVAEKDVGLAG